jgi:uncharacterized protein Veg
MTKIKDLKKDINNTLGEVIESALILQSQNTSDKAPETEAIIDETIEVFDILIAKINDKDERSNKGHFAGIRQELEAAESKLMAKIAALK